VVAVRIAGMIGISVPNYGVQILVDGRAPQRRRGRSEQHHRAGAGGGGKVRDAGVAGHHKACGSDDVGEFAEFERTGQQSDGRYLS